MPGDVHGQPPLALGETEQCRQVADVVANGLCADRPPIATVPLRLRSGPLSRPSPSSSSDPERPGPLFGVDRAPYTRAKSNDGRNFSVRKPRGDGGARRSGRVMRRYYVGCERSWSGGSPAGASGGTDPRASRSSLSMSRTGSFCPAALRANGPSSVHSSASRARASATYEASNALRRPSVAATSITAGPSMSAW